MRAVILANGEMTGQEVARRVLASADLVIAADGGALHVRALGVRPDAVIGDMDSLSEEDLAGLARAGVELVKHPARKDLTDLELALELARDRGADEIVVLGAMGRRWDMALANVMLLASPALVGCNVRLMDGPHEARLLRGGEKAAVTGRPGDTLSLIPLGRPAVGVTLTGLEYPLDRQTIGLGRTLGVSNVLVADTAEVELAEGLLLLVLVHAEPAG
ncbi:MAG: thiamine diphosphokinase [Thermodesulfobacteriota bacterium]